MMFNFFDGALFDIQNNRYGYSWQPFQPCDKETERLAKRLFRHAHFKGGGKSAGKLFGAIIFGFISQGFGFFGSGLSAISRFVMGASLFSSVWTAVSMHKSKSNVQGNVSVQRFDRQQEQMTADVPVQLVYGRRLITGNQTFHQTDADAKQLHKHVVLCEGGINKIVSVTANELLVPTKASGKKNESGVVFTVRNIKYENAGIHLSGKKLTLIYGDKSKEIQLVNKSDFEGSNDKSFWEWQVSISGLISYINRLGDGWQAFPFAATSKYPGDLHNIDAGCYADFAALTMDTVTGGTSYTFHDCEPPENYDETGGYPKMAWLDMYFTVSEELNGNPSVSCLVEGLKVMDTRSGRVEYTTNPAMCLRDFLLSKRYGLGKWITSEMLDEDSFKESADYCDEIISYLDPVGVMVREKRYELNMIIDQRMSAIEWLQEILANFCGYMTFTNGKFKLHIERETPISYRFNDDNCFDLAVAPLALSETPNKYSVAIVDPRNNWKSVYCICEDYADQKERQKIITKEVQLNGCTSQYQALRLARFYRDQNLACPLQLSFKTGVEGMHLEPGDVVTISYHGVFDGLPIRIAEIKETEEGDYEISGRQYNDSLYGDELSGGIHWHNYIGAKSMVTEENEIPPKDAKNVRAHTQRRLDEDGNTKYDIHVLFDLPISTSIECGQVFYKTKAVVGTEIGVFDEGVPADEIGWSRKWKFAGESPREFILRRVMLGETYRIRVVAKNKSGTTSDLDSAPEVFVKVTPKETVPSMPYNLRYNFKREFLFMWDDVPDSDVIYYELRLNENVGSPVGLLGRTSDTSAAVHLSSRVGTVYLYAINSLKKASYPAKVKYSYPKPPAPRNITFAEIPRGVNITVEEFPQNVLGMRLYIKGTGASDALDLTTNCYVFHGKPDIYEISASYIDLIGEGFHSAEFSCVINPTFREEWIQDGTLSVKKMDSEVSSVLNSAVQSVEDIKNINTDIRDIDTSILGLKETDKQITATLEDKERNLASQIRQTADSINATVQSKEANLTKAISQVSQKADSISSTVVENKRTQDAVNGQLANVDTQLASQIRQTADRISSVITSLNQNPSQSGYSALTQLQDGINARVVKGDVINQINMTATGTKIDGKYLHITGKTRFDNDIIASGMIKAGAISSDKIAARAITADKLNVDSLSAMSARIGVLRTKDSGARVEIRDNLILVYDENNVLRVKMGVW